MFNNDNGIVARSNPEYCPAKRHQASRYFASRVQENLTTRFFKLLCSVLLSLLFFAVIIIFIVWISLRPHRPRIIIHGFSVSGLGHDNGFDHTRITFNASVRNPNLNIGIYYNSMVGSVYYDDKQIVSMPLLFPFYQGPKNTTVVAATRSVGTSMWKNHRRMGSGRFRLDLTATIRFKISTWNSKRRRMHASCDVVVGSDGNILPLYKDKKCGVYFS